MSIAAPTSDAMLLDLLRTNGSMDVAALAARLDVTATAVRQRLSRLAGQGLVLRAAVRAGRGRPRHRYRLSPQGLRMTGSNFADLAQALWRAMQSIEDVEVRRELVRRIARSLAEDYGNQIEGDTTASRMRSLSELLRQRRVPFSVGSAGGLPVLTAHACPYPELAESDPAICEMEKLLFSELLGEEVQLGQCRLDGGSPCQFQPS